MERPTNHHILHTRVQWSSDRVARSLRDEPSLQIELPRPDHDYTHENAPHVPLLGPHALLIVRKEFEPHHNHKRAIDSLLKSIEKAGKHERAHTLETSLAQLAIWSIEEQIPYLQLNRYN